jgi:putative transcriptional regulator
VTNGMLGRMQSELVIRAGQGHDAAMQTSAGRRLANRLRIARAERAMSQEALARAVGVSRNTVGSIETGRYEPSALLAFRLAEVLGEPVDRLFWIEGGDR